MANRYLVKRPIQIRNENEVISYTIDVQPDSIKFKIEHNDPESLIDSEVTYKLVEWNLSLNTLKDSKVLKSNSLVTISVPDLLRDPSQAEITSIKDVGVGSIKNISTFTRLTKSDNPFTGQISHIPTYLVLFVKDVDGDFTDHDIIILVPSQKEYNFVSNQEFSEVAEDFSHVSLVDTITATKDTSYINDLYTRYTVTTAPHVDEVHVDPVIGIVDKTRVSIDTSGVGSFRLLKSSIEEGETPKIKLGFYSYTGLTTISE